MSGMLILGICLVAIGLLTIGYGSVTVGLVKSGFSVILIGGLIPCLIRQLWFGLPAVAKLAALALATVINFDYIHMMQIWSLCYAHLWCCGLGFAVLVCLSFS